MFERGEEVVVNFPAETPTFDPSYDVGGSNAYPWENLNPPSQVDIAPASQTSCQDLNNPGDDPAATADRCPVARNSFAYAGTAFSPTGVFGDVGLGSEPPRVDVTVYRPPFNAIGDYVWIDTNANGIQDPAESGIAGVTVELYDADGQRVATTTTDASGHYGFYFLDDDDYRVRFYPPSGYIVTRPNQSGNATGADEGAANLDGAPNTNNDSDVPVPPIGQAWTETALVHLARVAGDGEYDPSWDMGIFPEKYSLGNRVWLDDGAGGGGFNDGIHDAGEAPIANLAMVLYRADASGQPTGAPLAATSTNASGYYRFDNLDPGRYVVVVAASNFATGAALGKAFGSTGTTPSVNASDLDRRDHGLDAPLAGAIEPGGIASSVVTLGRNLQPTTDADPTTNPLSGESPNDFSNRTVDFGFHRGVRIGNLLWLDGAAADAGFNNGIADAGEPGIGGATVELWRDNGDETFDPSSDTRVDQTVTSPEGNYWFEGVTPGGRYFVAVASVPGLTVQSSTGQSADPNAADNDDDGAATSGYVTVSRLLTAPIVGGAALGEIDGTPAGDGSAETEANLATHTFPDANSNLRFDLGLIEVPLYRIGNLVWIDADKDGLAEPGELPIAGVRVELYDAAGAFVGFTTTGVDGKYLFANLVAGDYEVRIPATQTTLAGYKSSPVAVVDPDNDVDNDDNGSLHASGAYFTGGLLTVGEDKPTSVGALYNDEPQNEFDGLSATVVDDDLGSAVSPDFRSNLTADFGFYRPLFALGNELWIDLNDDGDIDAGEPVLPDRVLIRLLNADGTPVLDPSGNPRTTLSSDGRYLFDGLYEGTYIVEIAASNFATGAILEGFRSSTYDGVENVTDHDDNGVTQPGGAIRSGPFVLLEGDEPSGESPNGGTAPDNNSNMTVDFGLYAPLSLGNHVWFDFNDDGDVDSGEYGVPDDVVVNLLNADETPALNASGRRSPRPRRVACTSSPTSSPVPIGLRSQRPNFAAGGRLEGVRSSTPTATGDAITDDETDHGDAFAGGIRTGVIALAPLTEPTGENPDNDLVTRDANENLTWDIGVVPEFSLGNEVWLDLNDNGMIDETEAYVPDGVGVNLLRADGTPVLNAGGAPVSTTTTNGLYLFDHLLAGGYRVEIAAANFATGGMLGSARSSTPTAADDDVDHDDNATDSVNSAAQFVIRSGVVTLAWDDEPLEESPDNDAVTRDSNENLTWDIGIVPLFSIGNEVWSDLNDDSIRDATEPAIPNDVTIALFHGSGTPVVDSVGNPITTTITGGRYLFSGLLAGDYYVEIGAAAFAEGGLLEGYRSSTPTAPENAVDGDDNATAIDPAAPFTSGVRSATFTLSFDAEPRNETPDNDAVTRDSNENLTVDIGLHQPLFSLGNQVWYDLDDDGVRDATEPVLADGAPVRLYDEDGVLVASSTLTGGQYLFPGLITGQYYVEIDRPSGYTSSTFTAANTRSRPIKPITASTP